MAESLRKPTSLKPFTSLCPMKGLIKSKQCTYVRSTNKIEYLPPLLEKHLASYIFDCFS